MTYGVGFKRRSKRVQLTNQSVFASGSVAAATVARYRINAAGTVQTKAGTAAYVTEENWLVSGANTEFQMQLAQVSVAGSGGFSGTSTTWFDTTADREVTFTAGVGLVGQGTMTAKIRDKTTLVELASATIILDSEGV